MIAKAQPTETFNQREKNTANLLPHSHRLDKSRLNDHSGELSGYADFGRSETLSIEIGQLS
jgi:hypothetical protein